MSPSRVCLEAGCPNFATWRGRCDQHNRSRERSIKRAGKSIYGTKRWRLTRKKKLALNPICETEGCEELAEDVHHIEDIAEGGDPWSMENLESNCHAHHSRETRRRQLA